MSIHLSFLGATRTVTGSKYLLEINNKKILVDCGLFQGRREIRERNWAKFPIEADDIDAVILTHAHLDHSGYLPLLVKNGFTGPIYSTVSTKELCAILLPDSGHIQEEDAFFANKYRVSNHTPALPLYTKEDAEHVMSQFITIPYEHEYTLYPDCHFTFSTSAHILGSAFIRLKGEGSTIVFSGDIGRSHDPIMGEPSLIESADYLILESTYGDRLHDCTPPQDQLAEVINITVGRGGTIVIPAFAVGRTQSVLYYIAQLKAQNRIPDLPIFLDSPMAERVSDLYKHFVSTIPGTVRYIDTIEASKALDQSRFPSIIISASGMATGGRVVHHLKAFLPNELNTILFTGYQAEETLGQRIVSGAREVKIHGQIIPVRASISILSSLSAHADYAEILEWLIHFKKTPRQVFITHGEPGPALSLKEKIEAKLGWNCRVPAYLERVEL